MKAENILKSTQEQATASWINYLNQVRVNRLMEDLSTQNSNLEMALRELENLKKAIIEEIIQTNRGGIKGMHGFIAERMQVYIENARSLVEGANRKYFLLDDNGPVDYIKNGINYQQKFVQRHFSLDAVSEHLAKYPDYIKNGGKYHIPKDYYEKIMKLFNMPENEASKLSKEEYRLWLYIKNFFKTNNISPNDLEGTVIDYSEAQSGKANETIENEKKNIKRKDQEEREKIYKKSKPSVKEGAKVTAISALIEGGVSFGLAIQKKRKSGKKLSEFTEEDWKEIGIGTAKGTGRGAIRGSVIYIMTNFTLTPAAVASGLVTAVLGMKAEAEKLRKGFITKEEFLVNSEVLSLDVTISTLSSILGEILIPIPVLGAVIGNVAGTYMYDIAKRYLDNEEEKLISSYNTNINMLNQYLDEEYKMILKLLKEEFKKYKSLIDLAFSKDINKAFEGSISLAEYIGVDNRKILRNMKDIDVYFLN